MGLLVGGAVKFVTAAMLVLPGIALVGILGRDNPLDDPDQAYLTVVDLLLAPGVRGGIDVPDYLGSRSTFTLGQFGGHGGRALRAGDVLHLAPLADPTAGQRLPPALTPPLPALRELRVLYGPHGAPDYFSAEGQLWGNPQYNWQLMRDTGFQWWLQRFDSAAKQFDIARIDHFRALQAYWEIPASATSARDGHWVEAPGRELLQAVRANYPELKLVAENLGSITAEVEDLRKEFGLPGMLILQFAFDGNPDNPYLNHLHSSTDIVYTGTHDNNTTLGWFESLDEATRAKVYAYYGNPSEPMPWMLIHQAMASPANTAVIPWQDFLGLDGSHRMNTPGTTQGNWRWRFDWSQVPADLATRIRDMLAASDRQPPECASTPNTDSDTHSG